MKTKNIILAVMAIVSLQLKAQVEGPFTLEQLKEKALQQNIAIRSAQHNMETATQQRKEAFTKYFPTVSATGAWFNADKGMARMDVDPAGMLPPELGGVLGMMLPAEALAALSSPFSMTMMKNGTLAGITAMQPLFAGGQIVNGNRLARVAEEAARLQVELSENEVEQQTEKYYWQLAALCEKQRTLDAADTLLADICREVEVAVRAGVAMGNDLLQVQLRQNDIQSQRLKLQNGIFIVKQLLGQYAGLTPTDSAGMGSVYRFDIVTPVLSGQTDCQLPALQSEEETVRLTPEYQLLEKQVEAAKLQRRLTIGQHLPTVAVGAGYNYHNLLDNDRTFGMLFATVNIPISDWWAGSHAIRRRTIAQQRAQEQLADNTQLLHIRLQKAANDVTEAYQQLGLAQQAIRQAQENLRLHRDYYRVGTGTLSDLLEAQLLYQQTLDRHTEAYADLQNKLTDYRIASAGQ